MQSRLIDPYSKKLKSCIGTSQNNIVITDPQMADGFTGMLIDLDLAIVYGDRRAIVDVRSPCVGKSFPVQNKRPAHIHPCIETPHLYNVT
jgi:Fungal protein kinase